MINHSLFPHVNGVPNFAAQGNYALCYKHPKDENPIMIFDGVSLEFINEYLESRDWVTDAVMMGWEFQCINATTTTTLC